MQSIHVGPITIGEGAERLTLIAGPCVAESLDLCRDIARQAKAACEEAGFGYVFKASFDKANRTSIRSYRGPGLDTGLEILAAVKSELDVPVLTDVHETWQAKPVAEVANILQIPAFLARQTDLVVAAAETGRALNIKKAQFMAPWDMANVVQKAADAGNPSVLLTERGTSFGYNTLIVDMYALPQMRALGYPVCFDATHSVQMPGAQGTQSGGRREAIPYLTRAAVAVGIDALFMEVHPEPEKGLSDPATMYPLGQLKPLLQQLAALHRLAR